MSSLSSLITRYRLCIEMPGKPVIKQLFAVHRNDQLYDIKGLKTLIKERFAIDCEIQILSEGGYGVNDDQHIDIIGHNECLTIRPKPSISGAQSVASNDGLTQAITSTTDDNTGGQTDSASTSSDTTFYDDVLEGIVIDGEEALEPSVRREDRRQKSGQSGRARSVAQRRRVRFNPTVRLVTINLDEDLEDTDYEIDDQMDGNRVVIDSQNMINTLRVPLTRRSGRQRRPKLYSDYSK